jgi:hypothetical protein
LRVFDPSGPSRHLEVDPADWPFIVFSGAISVEVDPDWPYIIFSGDALKRLS